MTDGSTDLRGFVGARKSGLRRGQFVAEVAANLPLCLDHFKLTLHVTAFPPTQPGQFIQIACRDWGSDFTASNELEYTPTQPPHFGGQELCQPLAFLRRPFSLAGRKDIDGRSELEIIHRVVGVGTDWLSHLCPGDSVYILGPLGNSFELPPENGTAILVGGGVGIPPMLYLAEALAGRKAIAFCGALNRDLLPLRILSNAPAPTADSIEPLHNIDEFARHGIGAVISTDDGSYGFRGFVTQALEGYLDRHLKTRGDQSPVIIYTCGPEPMMKRVADIAAAREIDCQIAVERAMACGMGTCQSCCIRVRKPDPAVPPLAGREWCYRLACTDGPVFRGADLLW